LGLPSADEIMRRRREEERNRYPDPSRDPSRGPVPTGGPEDRPPDPSERNKTIPRVPDSRPTSVPSTSRRDEDESIKGMLDMAYLTADSYLKALADKSGGRMLRADTIASLPDAFGQIAAELRTQYMLGYYPINKERDERYRKIKVETTRKNVVIRSRPGYLATQAR
jgi:VWFA-related protein